MISCAVDFLVNLSTKFKISNLKNIGYFIKKLIILVYLFSPEIKSFFIIRFYYILFKIDHKIECIFIKYENMLFKFKNYVKSLFSKIYDKCKLVIYWYIVTRVYTLKALNDLRIVIRLVMHISVNWEVLSISICSLGLYLLLYITYESINVNDSFNYIFPNNGMGTGVPGPSNPNPSGPPSGPPGGPNNPIVITNDNNNNNNNNNDNNYYIFNNQRHYLANHKFTTIPDERRNDIVFLKLAIQWHHNTMHDHNLSYNSTVFKHHNLGGFNGSDINTMKVMGETMCERRGITITGEIRNNDRYETIQVRNKIIYDVNTGKPIVSSLGLIDALHKGGGVIQPHYNDISINKDNNR